MKLVSVQELNQWMSSENDSFQLVDVREPYELEICSLNAIHIPMGEIITRIKELKNNVKTCVLCKSGRRAAAVANLLETDFGFKDIHVVDGGIIAYATKIDKNLEIYE